MLRTSIGKLLVAGDSLNDSDTYDDPKHEDWGTNIRDKNWRGWVDILAMELDAPVVNSAVGGITMEKIISDSNSYIWSYNPTHVIMNGGDNDLHFAEPEPTESTVNIVYDYIRNIVSMVGDVNIEITYLIIPTINKSNHEQITKMYGEAMTAQRIESIIEMKKLLLSKIRKGLQLNFPDCHIIDLEGSSLGMTGKVNTDLYFQDTVHPNENGQMVIANAVKKFIKETYGKTDLIPKFTTPAPAGPILVNGKQLYLTLNGKQFPLYIGDMPNKTQAVHSIKWRC